MNNTYLVTTTTRRCPVCGADLSQPIMVASRTAVCNSCRTKLRAKANESGLYELRPSLTARLVWWLRRRFTDVSKYRP